MTETIRILIVDDHTVVRDGLNALLSLEQGVRTWWERPQTAREPCAWLRELQPDVILLDLVMPNMDGVQATLEIKKVFPTARILVLTSFAENHQVFSAYQGRRDRLPDERYLLRRSLIQAIRYTYENRSALGPNIARKLMGIFKTREEGWDEGALHWREVEILQQMAFGRPTRRSPTSYLKRADGAHACYEYPGQIGAVEPDTGSVVRPARGHCTYRLHHERTRRGISQRRATLKAGYSKGTTSTGGDYFCRASTSTDYIDFREKRCTVTSVRMGSLSFRPLNTSFVIS